MEKLPKSADVVIHVHADKTQSSMVVLAKSHKDYDIKQVKKVRETIVTDKRKKPRGKGPTIDLAPGMDFTFGKF